MKIKENKVVNYDFRNGNGIFESTLILLLIIILSIFFL